MRDRCPPFLLDLPSTGDDQAGPDMSGSLRPYLTQLCLEARSYLAQHPRAPGRGSEAESGH